MKGSGKRPPSGSEVRGAAGRYGNKSSKVTMPKETGGRQAAKSKGASSGSKGY